MEWYEAAFDRFYPLVYAHRDITEAEKVVEAKPVALTKFLNSGSFDRSSGGSDSASNQSQMLTYSRQGMADAALQPAAGRLFDAYA